MSTKSAKYGKILRLPPQLDSSGSNVSGHSTLLLGPHSTEQYSENFRVDMMPVTLRIFNAILDDVVLIEHVAYLDECSMLSQPAVVNGHKLQLTSSNTQIELSQSGLYRCHILLPASVGQVSVISTDNFVPSGVIRHGK
jgi:hypothetical protein